MGLEGVVGSESGCVFGSSLASDPETKHKWYGSGVLKQERSAIASEDDEWGTYKVAKIDHDMSSAPKAMIFQQRNNSLLRSNNATLFSDGHHQSQMLSFSSPKSETLLVDTASSNATLPFSYHQLSSYSRNEKFLEDHEVSGSGNTQHVKFEEIIESPLKTMELMDIQNNQLDIIEHQPMYLLVLSFTEF